MKTIDYTKYPVPRLRHHANPVLYFPLKQHKNRANFKYPPLVDKFEWSELFSNGKAPEYLDIGSGMGKFLIETAAAVPNINILGFEIRKNAVEWVNNVILGENVSNARRLWYSVVNGFPFYRNKFNRENILFISRRVDKKAPQQAEGIFFGIIERILQDAF